MTYLESNLPLFLSMGHKAVADLMLCKDYNRSEIKDKAGMLTMSTGDTLKVYFNKFLELFGYDRTNQITDIAWNYINDGYNYMFHGQGENGQLVDLSHIKPLPLKGPASEIADVVYNVTGFGVFNMEDKPASSSSQDQLSAEFQLDNLSLYEDELDAQPLTYEDIMLEQDLKRGLDKVFGRTTYTSAPSLDAPDDIYHLL